MLNKCDFLNVDGTHTYSMNGTQSPLNLFDVDVTQRVDTNRNKSQYHGINPTVPYRGAMEIHCEGALFADTTSNYRIERKNLLLALFGDPNAAISRTNRKSGTLTINIDGESEDWKCDCTVTLFTAPVRGLYPAFSEYAVTFVSPNPWFIGVTSSNRYYWS